MSGHSKWATTKRQKAVVDAKRSSLFTKLAKNIAVAAREGADPKMNFKLRIAIDKAKELSMPRDNIERAVARGSGTGSEARLESVLYEGFGPGGIAVMVEAVTDNRNRTISDVRTCFSKHGGNLGSAGSVHWMFEPRSIITVTQSNLTDEQELTLIDTGLLDAEPDESGATLYGIYEELQHLKEAAEQNGLTVSEATTGFVAKELVPVEKSDSILSLLNALDDLDDVHNVYTNANLS